LVNTVLAVSLGGLLLPAAAGAGVSLDGGNTDFPDETLVMPFAAAGQRTTFLSLSNVGNGVITTRWVFYDESGQRLDQVERAVYGEGGTDLVDVTAIRDRTIDGSGQYVEGPPRSLAGREGFAVVFGVEGEPRLIGNFTIANLTTNSAFGVNATGLGIVGSLRQGGFLLGTTFNPATLQDNLLVILALNTPQDTSLTNGEAPPTQPVFNVEVFLQGNDPNNATIAETTVAVTGSALFTTLQELFPGTALNSSASIFVRATEGPGYGGSGLDPDDDNGIGIIGYYGQALGPFGAGQTLRAGAFFE
jgi:hypothetical protein